MSIKNCTSMPPVHTNGFVGVYFYVTYTYVYLRHTFRMYNMNVTAHDICSKDIVLLLYMCKRAFMYVSYACVYDCMNVCKQVSAYVR